MNSITEKARERRKTMRALVISFVAAACILAWTQTSSALEVVEAAMCRDVQNKQPVEIQDSFPADVGKVWCWSKISSGQDDVIKHIYYYRNSEMAEVELPIRSQSFRTYSSKRILPEWTGLWHVEIVDSEGNILQRLSFSVGDAGEAEAPAPPDSDSPDSDAGPAESAE
jgi:hypothetical protein